MSPAGILHHWIKATQADVPRPRRVLTEPDGPILWADCDRATTGVIELTDGRYAVIASDPAENLDVVEILIHEATQCGFRPSIYYHVDAETLAALHRPKDLMRSTRRDGSAVEQRNARDHEIDRMFTAATAMKCTDVHLIMESATGHIAFRVHGDFVSYQKLAHDHFRALCHAIYQRTSSDTKTRDWAPQSDQEASGTFTLANGTQLRFRYQSLDRSPEGFKIVLRVLDDSLAISRLGFPALGYTEHQVAGLISILNKPRGVTLLSGPVNSGKSTTLVESYQYLRARHGSDYNIHTLEHPVEYRVPGITQSNVRYSDHKDAGGAWARAMAALMRMDVNCIGLGEIRDGACAEISQQLVDTGHKLLASIHAGDPWDAANRFVKWGCPAESVWDCRFLSGVVSQELVPVLCPECSVPYAAANLAEPIRRTIDKLLNAKMANPAHMRVSGEGCDRCNGLGRIGRTVVAEILDPTPDLMATAALHGWRAAMKAWANEGVGNPHHAPYRKIDHAFDKVLAGVVCPVLVDHKIQSLTDYERELRRGRARPTPVAAA
jgi:type II secretory ATPase GspE/PulE/Tfp pilus assembly ATPase PilB-like protein